MFNGLKDVVVVPPAAKILQIAAPNPNQVVWYNGGHDVPDAIRSRAVAWLTKQLKPEGELAQRQHERRREEGRGQKGYEQKGRRRDKEKDER